MGDPSNPEIQYTMPKFMIGDLGSASLGVAEGHNQSSSSPEAPQPGTKPYGRQRPIWTPEAEMPMLQRVALSTVVIRLRTTRGDGLALDKSEYATLAHTTQ
jgi:hypothetical protein